MKTKLRFKLAVSRDFNQDRVDCAWREWRATPDALMGFYGYAVSEAMALTLAKMKGIRLMQKMQRMRDAKVAKRLAVGH